jgi:hypothetical protein
VLFGAFVLWWQAIFIKFQKMKAKITTFGAIWCFRALVAILIYKTSKNES